MSLYDKKSIEDTRGSTSHVKNYNLQFLKPSPISNYQQVLLWQERLNDTTLPYSPFIILVQWDLIKSKECLWHLLVFSSSRFIQNVLTLHHSSLIHMEAHRISEESIHSIVPNMRDFFWSVIESQSLNHERRINSFSILI